MWCHLTKLSWLAHVSLTFIMFLFYSHQTYDMTWIHYIYIWLSCLPQLYFDVRCQPRHPPCAHIWLFQFDLHFHSKILVNLKNSWITCDMTKLNNKIINTINHHGNYFIPSYKIQGMFLWLFKKKKKKWSEVLFVILWQHQLGFWFRNLQLLSHRGSLERLFSLSK